MPMVKEQARWDLVTRGDGQYLLCPALAGLAWLRHGFSVGPALNFGLHVGEPAPAAIARREGFLAGLGLELSSLVAAQQVHGTRVAVVGGAERGAGAVDYAEALPETDGLATRTSGLTLSVYYADCAPLLLVDPEARTVAAVHAGWRGAVAGIAARAVEVMREALSADPSRILAAIGPAIGPCCYTVGPEVASRVPAGARPLVLAAGQEDSHRLDLAGLSAWWLRQAGLAAEHIFTAGECTGCRPDLYPSHRRQGTRAGRMMAVIARVD